MEKKNNNLVIILMGVIIIILAVLCVLFATDTIKFSKTESNDINKQDKEISTNDDNLNNETSINSKLVSLSDCSNSTESYNNINVSVEQVNNESMCTLNKMIINNKNIKEKLSAYIKSYEFYDDKVIIVSGDTSNSTLYIYDTKTDNVEKINLNNYKLVSYISDNNKLTIIGKECGPQCGTEYSEYPNAKFELLYNNGTFGEVKLIEKIK